MRSILLSLVFVVLTASAAFSYVGPGTGITLIGSLIGILAAVGAALWALIAYPLRRLNKRPNAAGNKGETPEPAKD